MLCCIFELQLCLHQEIQWCSHPGHKCGVTWRQQCQLLCTFPLILCLCQSSSHQGVEWDLPRLDDQIFWPSICSCLAINLVLVKWSFGCSKSGRNDFSDLQHLLFFKNIISFSHHLEILDVNFDLAHDTLDFDMMNINIFPSPLLQEMFPPSPQDLQSNKQPDTLEDWYSGNRVAQWD